MIEVYGVRDDVIEVRGDIIYDFVYDPCARNSHGDTMGHVLGFSDGTLLRIQLDEDAPGPYGIWHIKVIQHGQSDVSIVHKMVDENSYDSDHATIGGDIQWVMLGDDYGQPNRELVSHEEGGLVT